jgi:hypothetical protein
MSLWRTLGKKACIRPNGEMSCANKGLAGIDNVWRQFAAKDGRVAFWRVFGGRFRHFADSLAEGNANNH